MQKKKFYKSFLNHKASFIQGVFALDDGEQRTIREEFAMPLRNKKFRRPFLSKMSGFLKTFVVMEFIQTTQGQLGDVISNYLRGIRKQHAVYNIYFFVLNSTGKIPYTYEQHCGNKK